MTDQATALQKLQVPFPVLRNVDMMVLCQLKDYRPRQKTLNGTAVAIDEFLTTPIDTGVFISWQQRPQETICIETSTKKRTALSHVDGTYTTKTITQTTTTRATCKPSVPRITPCCMGRNLKLFLAHARNAERISQLKELGLGGALRLARKEAGDGRARLTNALQNHALHGSEGVLNAPPSSKHLANGACIAQRNAGELSDVETGES